MMGSRGIHFLTVCIVTGAILVGSLLGLNFTEVLAAPSISGLSGPHTHGSTVTITGSGFGTKNPAKPHIWANFENGTITANSSLSLGTLLQQNSSITNVGQPPNSKFSTRSMPNDPVNGKRGGRLFTSANTNKTYTFVRRKYDHPDWWNVMDQRGYSNYKFIRFFPTCSKNYINVYLVVFHLGGQLHISVENAGESGVRSKYAGTPPVERWFTEEFQTFQGGIDVNNSKLTYWMQGGPPLFTHTFVGRTTKYPSFQKCFDVENFWAHSPPPSGAYTYFDDYYFDTTWSRVMIGNKSTFKDSTHREIQIPISWSSNSIKISVNQGTFNGSENSYLYVFDSNGNVNTNGYPFTTSSGQLDTTPPSKPTNLRVN